MKFTIPFFVILLFGFAAYGQTGPKGEKNRWTPATESKEFVVYGDADSMEKDGNGKQMWFKFVPRNKKAFAAKKKLAPAFDHFIVLIRFNCGEKTATIKKSIDYAANGEILKTHAPNTLIKDFEPDSIYDQAYPLLCREG